MSDKILVFRLSDYDALCKDWTKVVPLTSEESSALVESIGPQDILALFANIYGMFHRDSIADEGVRMYNRIPALRDYIILPVDGLRNAYYISETMEDHKKRIK